MIKNSTKATKKLRPTSQPSAGPDGAALVPPAYGVDFLDQARPESGPALQRKANPAAAEQPAPEEAALAGVNSPGQALEGGLRARMEAGFGSDFSAVRVHSDEQAAQSARAVQAQAFTLGQDVVFAQGQYQPDTSQGQELLAHELTHVVQQRGAPGGPAQAAATISQPGDAGEREAERTAAAVATGQTGVEVKVKPGQGSLQRAVEVRPPGKGEASAFDRRQKLIDRMNTISPAIQYHLTGQRIEYDIINEPALKPFDRQMRAFIDRAEVTPLRLISSAGRVQGGAGFQPLLIDSFVNAYLDLDDMLTCDLTSFQMNLIHLLVERFEAHDYARRVGTNFSMAEFNRAHQAGLVAETEYLRAVTGDPSLRLPVEETKPNGTLLFIFNSKEGYQVYHVFRHAGQEQQGGEVFVYTKDGRQITVDQLAAERAPVAAPVGP